ncbi:unnamed protein product [Heligmosomoides polygyrus]|uniref:CUPID domain-containing protein n=1 Tax=Heligmosomoides polygyrus TaxID=6339 RepID=A0A3P8AY40_HELPZ|nr:unnamed protein product [Heligmosomoides polygyrus]
MLPNTRKSEEEEEKLAEGYRRVKDEDHSSDSGELCNSILESCRRAESADREVRDGMSGSARFARKELDYIAEMYCENYDIFHKSSLGGGRAKEAIALKRKLLQEMADHLSTIADEKRTVMQVDQKIRDEVRQVKKHLRHKRLDMLGMGCSSREIRLSSSQQYIADQLKQKPKLASIICSDVERLTEDAIGLMSLPNEQQMDYAAGCSSVDCEFYQMVSEVIYIDTLEELQKEVLRADVECLRARTEAAMEERRYWEEKRSLLALERQMLLERQPSRSEEPQCYRDRLSTAFEERQLWEERRRILAMRRQCMLEQLESV